MYELRNYVLQPGDKIAEDQVSDSSRISLVVIRRINAGNDTAKGASGGDDHGAPHLRQVEAIECCRDGLKMIEPHRNG
jgi:hypothetical protein